MTESAPVSSRACAWLGALIGAVWIFHGLYSKLLGGIPRHRLIVGRILGEDLAEPATLAIGILEIGLGMWALTGWRRPTCALVQTLAIGAMNALEIALARDLLLSAGGMVALNLVFLALVWRWARPGVTSSTSPPAAGRRP